MDYSGRSQERRDEVNRTGRTVPITLSVLAALVVSACSVLAMQAVRGSGNAVEQDREVSGISAVNLATIGDLAIEVGDAESLRIEAQENILPFLETEVRNGVLTIGSANNVRLLPTRSIRYYLTVTDLDSISISSVGDIAAPDLETERLSIRISSTGDLEMGDLVANTLTVGISSTGDVRMGELNADTLEVNIESTGSLDIAGGAVRSQEVTISSTGEYRARDVASDEATVRLSSSGSATIWVQNTLRATLSSSGDLRYRGSPTVDATTTSSGDVEPIGE
jgi:hypothetical protein